MNAEPAFQPSSAPGNYQVGDLLIDVGVRRVTREGLDLGITGLSFDLLLALVRTAPDLVSTRKLMDRVWPGVVISPETVTQRIKLLRRSLGDSAESPHYVAAVRRHGYRIAAPVTRPAPELGQADQFPAPPAPVAHVAATELFSPSGRGTWNRIAAVLGLAALLTASGLWWWHEHPRARVALGSEPRPITSALPRSSVAVMPFANLTGEPAKEYLGDGMAEELINTLAQVPGLKVPARTSTFAYQGRNVDIRRIARDLGVATILEGSVRSTGEHLRVSARLVDAASGYQIWSQDYDRQSTDIFKLQDDLAGQIVEALRGYLNVELTVPTGRQPPTRDVRAYELYLQARLVGRGTLASVRQALPLVDQALVRDTDFADARAFRAILLAGSTALGSGPPTLVADAQREIDRALALSPNSAEAHTAQEVIDVMQGRWIDAQTSFRAAMVRGADDPEVRDFHPFLISRPAGRIRQSQAEFTAAYHLAPTYGWTPHELAITESLLGHDAEAEKFVELEEQMYGVEQPVRWDIALIHARAAAHSGRYDEAAGWAIQALPDSLRNAGAGPVMHSVYAALADPAKRPAARKALQDFVPRLTDSIDFRIWTVFVDGFTEIGDLDGAFALAERLTDQPFGAHAITLSGDVWRPEMRAFREDARFGALMARTGLFDYWKQYGPPDNCELKDERLSCR